MRKNEHPQCSCSTCRRAAATPWGKYVHRQVNRRIRHNIKRLLARDGVEFVPVTRSTPCF